LLVEEYVPFCVFLFSVTTIIPYLAAWFLLFPDSDSLGLSVGTFAVESAIATDEFCHFT